MSALGNTIFYNETFEKMKISNFVIPAFLLLGSLTTNTTFACDRSSSVRVYIPTPEDIYFDYNSAFLREESIGQIRDNARWFRLNDAKVLIEGHCDERGSVSYNHRLGYSRAEEAKHYMIDIGFDASKIMTVGIGEDRPLAFGHTQADWALNRRDHFVPAE